MTPAAENSAPKLQCGCKSHDDDLDENIQGPPVFDEDGERIPPPKFKVGQAVRIDVSKLTPEQVKKGWFHEHALVEVPTGELPPDDRMQDSATQGSHPASCEESGAEADDSDKEDDIATSQVGSDKHDSDDDDESGKDTPLTMAPAKKSSPGFKVTPTKLT